MESSGPCVEPAYPRYRRRRPPTRARHRPGRLRRPSVSPPVEAARKKPCAGVWRGRRGEASRVTLLCRVLMGWVWWWGGGVNEREGVPWDMQWRQRHKVYMLWCHTVDVNGGSQRTRPPKKPTTNPSTLEASVRTPGHGQRTRLLEMAHGARPPKHDKSMAKTGGDR